MENSQVILNVWKARNPTINVEEISIKNGIVFSIEKLKKKNEILNKLDL